MTAFCVLGHTQRAHECPACGEAATGRTASLDHWRWYRGRTSSKRIKALVDEQIKAMTEFGEFVIPAHVVGRVRERLGWTGGWREIRVEARLDVLAGRVTQTRPNWTRSDAYVGGRQDRVLYAYDAAATRCWVLLQSGARVVVKTVLLNEEIWAQNAADQMIRTGMVRR